MTRGKKGNGEGESGGGASVTAGDNSQGIKRDLLQLGREIRDLEAEKTLITDQLKEKRAAVRETGMSMAEFKYAFSLWMLEDEDAKRERMERLHLALEAFGVGGQGELVFGQGAAGAGTDASHGLH